MEEEEGATVAKMNSGEGIREMCDSKVERQGAGGEGRWCVVVDIVRRRRDRRWVVGEAIIGIAGLGVPARSGTSGLGAGEAFAEEKITGDDYQEQSPKRLRRIQKRIA